MTKNWFCSISESLCREAFVRKNGQAEAEVVPSSSVVKVRVTLS